MGRLFSGSHRIPFALALIHGPQGIAVDTILLDEKQSVSILSASSAHSYSRPGIVPTISSIF